jgi:hypothetical protein
MDYFEYIIYFVCWFLKLYCTSLFLGIRVFNATFNNIIKFVSDLCQVGGIHQVLHFPPTLKLTATT